MDHTDLLLHAPNKYELVLKVARRAKLIKDEMAKTGAPEVKKPIQIAIEEILAEELNGEPRSA